MTSIVSNIQCCWKKRPVTPSELWNNKGDKRNTNTKTPVECEKCISHPNLMIQNTFSEKKKKFPYFSSYSCTCRYYRCMCIYGPGVCVYTDTTLQKQWGCKINKNKKLTAALYIKIMLFDVHVLILFTFIGVLC